MLKLEGYQIGGPRRLRSWSVVIVVGDVFVCLVEYVSLSILSSWLVIQMWRDLKEVRSVHLIVSSVK